MKNLSFKTKLLLLVGSALLGLLIFGVVSFTTLSAVKIGSLTYGGIIMTKDVNADYVPPSQSLVGAAVHAVKMEEAPDAATTQHFLQLLREDEKSFQEGHAKWMKDLPEGKLKTLVGGLAYNSAQEWFRIMEEEFIPAVLSGDRKLSHEIRITKMAKQYTAQQETVAEIVKATDEIVTSDQAEAEALVQSRSRTLLLVGVLALAVVVFLSYFIARGILGPLHRTLTVLRR